MHLNVHTCIKQKIADIRKVESNDLQFACMVSTPKDLIAFL